MKKLYAIGVMFFCFYFAAYPVIIDAAMVNGQWQVDKEFATTYNSGASLAKSILDSVDPNIFVNAINRLSDYVQRNGGVKAFQTEEFNRLFVEEIQDVVSQSYGSLDKNALSNIQKNAAFKKLVAAASKSPKFGQIVQHAQNTSPEQLVLSLTNMSKETSQAAGAAAGAAAGLGGAVPGIIAILGTGLAALLGIPTLGGGALGTIGGTVGGTAGGTIGGTAGGTVVSGIADVVQLIASTIADILLAVGIIGSDVVGGVVNLIADVLSTFVPIGSSAVADIVLEIVDALTAAGYIAGDVVQEVGNVIGDVLSIVVGALGGTIGGAAVGEGADWLERLLSVGLQNLNPMGWLVPVLGAAVYGAGSAFVLNTLAMFINLFVTYPVINAIPVLGIGINIVISGIVGIVGGVAGGIGGLLAGIVGTIIMRLVNFIEGGIFPIPTFDHTFWTIGGAALITVVAVIAEAIVGGLAGVVIGLPLLLVGAIPSGILGAFLGAAAGLIIGGGVGLIALSKA